MTYYNNIQKLCAQQKTTFTNNLLQDITICTGTNTSQLEDWLTDIESAADLTHESYTKLAQAKSKGLIRTLILEALNSDTSWDKIKDLLQLKLYNSDIHTSISHFMDIQQKDKESLAVYIHCFNREAKRCHFDNSAATIRLFLKGLKDAHTLAACVYEKSPQILVGVNN